MVIQENDPNLKSNDNFRDLMVAISGAQSRVLIAQKDYNLAAQDYNTELRTFPGVVWAKTAHSSAKPMAYFTSLDPAAATPGGAVKAPEVNLDSVGAPASK